MPPKLFTIGYEGLDVADLVAQLHKEGITRIVDVRELPLSRRPGFSKARLAAALQEAGIAYEHVRALGNPKPLRDRFKAGDVVGGALDYRAHLHNGSREALLELGPRSPTNTPASSASSGSTPHATARSSPARSRSSSSA